MEAAFTTGRRSHPVGRAAGLFPISDAGTGADRLVFALASRYGVSGYDASYLELAGAEKLPLATLDKKLAAEAAAEREAVLGPLAP